MSLQLLLAALPLISTPPHGPQEVEPARSIFSGTVTDATGSPVKGATVWSLTPSGDVQRARSEADGSYALVDVPLDAEGLKLWAGSDHHFIKELTVPAPPSGEDRTVVPMDVGLAAKPTIVVRVVGEGGGPALPLLLAHGELKSLIFPELQAVATLEAPGAMLDLYPYVRLQKRGVGTFRKPRKSREDRLGTITLDQDVNVQVSLVAFQVVLETKTVPQGQAEVTFEVTPENLLELMGSVRVRFLSVVDDELGPAEGKGAVKPSPYSSMGFGNDLTKSDDEGWLILDPVLPGSRWLHFDPASFASLACPPLPAVLGPGEDLNLGTITLRPPVSFKGVPRDANGEPRKTAMRLFKLAPDGSLADGSSAIYASAKPGALDAHVPEPAEYRLELCGIVDYDNPEADIWCGDTMRVDLRAEQEDPLILPVRRGVPVRVLSPSLAGGLYTGLSVRFTDAAGHVRHPASARGSYFMVPGRYAVSLVRDGEAFAEQSITVAEEPVVVYFDADGS